MRRSRQYIAFAASAYTAFKDIVKGTHRITTEIAIRFDAFYGNSHRFWINGQVRDNIRKAGSNDAIEQIKSEIEPLKQAF